MKTSTIKQPIGTWYMVDAEGKTIGRIAANIAHVLRGKHRPTFSPHQLCTDHVVVVNIEKMAIPARKLLLKTYFRHSGYLGHWRQITLQEMMEKHPDRVLELAVKGMLKATRLRPRMLKQLHIFQGSEHTYAAQKPTPLTFTV
jgi:large subunit ribosomal protein L13